MCTHTCSGVALGGISCRSELWRVVAPIWTEQGALMTEEGGGAHDSGPGLLAVPLLGRLGASFWEEKTLRWGQRAGVHGTLRHTSG